jgi:hypothetical protein
MIPTLSTKHQDKVAIAETGAQRPLSPAPYVPTLCRLARMALHVNGSMAVDRQETSRSSDFRSFPSRALSPLGVCSHRPNPYPSMP